MTVSLLQNPFLAQRRHNRGELDYNSVRQFPESQCEGIADAIVEAQYSKKFKRVYEYLYNPWKCGQIQTVRGLRSRNVRLAFCRRQTSGVFNVVAAAVDSLVAVNVLEVKFSERRQAGKRSTIVKPHATPAKGKTGDASQAPSPGI